MKTHIEKTLERIHHSFPHMSCDIYHDSLKEQFVVKLQSLGITQHFRSDHIRKSLRMATEWLKKNCTPCP